MSDSKCYLLNQNDWLEYENASSSTVKIILGLVAILGIAILTFTIQMDIKLKTYKPSMDVINMFKILYTLCAVMICVPIVLIVLDMNVNYKKPTNIPYVMIGIVALTCLSIIILSIVVALQIQMQKIGTPSRNTATAVNLFNISIWIPVGLLMALNAGLLIYKFKTANNIDIAKRRIDWTNPREVEPFLRQVAQKQYAKCNVAYGEDVSEEIPILAFANYVEQRKLHALKTGGRIPKLPSDMIPNLPKMEWQLNNDVEAAKNKTVSTLNKLATTVADKNREGPTQTVAERLAKNVPPSAVMQDAYGNSALWDAMTWSLGKLAWPIRKVGQFTGITNPFNVTS